MSDTQIINQLKFKISSLQSQLADKQKSLQEYQTIQSQADTKIKALTKMHADKIKNLLNSIQILKKQKASIQGLSKQHKRSKLIEQLNKQIADQDLAIQVLRKWVYDKEGKDKGRQVCDQIIVKALTKGPDRIRPLSRQQLRIEIDRLKSININLQSKFKNGGVSNIKNKQNNSDQLSQVSSVTQQSFVNTNDEILKKLKQYQFENQNMKLQINAKLKIIEKLKTDLKQTDRLKTQLQIYKNQVEVANKKVSTYERLMKQSKQNTNIKIVQLYERQIKVQQLQMVSRENRDKLKQAQQTHNIMLEQMKLQKEQLQAEIDNIKGQNEQIILQNISTKKKLDEARKQMADIESLYSRQKQDMAAKIRAFTQQIQRIVADNKKYNDAYRNAQATLFKQRAEWVDQKQKLLLDLNNTQKNKANTQLMEKYLQDITALKKQNGQLKQLMDGGSTGTGNDKVLLSRLASLQQKLKFYESKGKVSQNQLYNQLYTQYNDLLQKYNELLQQFESYKQKYGPKHKDKNRRQQIQISKKQKQQYEIMSSGISRLDLQDIGSDILDNFDSSLQYQFIINQYGDRVKMPKLTQADRQLVKLMTSDLWQFVTDNKMEQKLKKAAQFVSQDQDGQINVDWKQVRQIRNLSNPKGKKLLMYQQQINEINNISDSVSITSALQKQLNKYDSDVNVQIKRLPKGSTLKPMNKYKVQDASLSVSGQAQSQLSSVKLGQSDIIKKKKKVDQKGSRIDIKKLRQSQKSSDFQNSQIGSDLLDSDVSSGGIRQSQLAKMDSDVSFDFKKKRT